MSVLNVGGGEYINVDGNMVEKDALHIAERLAEYDPAIHVICIPPELAGINEAPFIIAELCPDGEMRRIFECWELNASVIERVQFADSHHYDVQSKIDYANSKVYRQQQQRYEERRLETIDISKHVLKTKQSKFTFRNEDGTKTTIFDDRPAERK